MQISKWGNSLAVRLPASVVEELGLKEGDDIEIRVAASGKFELSRSMTMEERLARLRRSAKRLPRDFRFDRDEAHER